MSNQQVSVEEAMKIASKISYADLIKTGDITVDKLWLIMAATLFKDKQVSDTQFKEMRKAFYIGFSECFRIMTDLADGLSEEDASKMLFKFHQEVNQFHDENIHDILGAKKH